MLSNSTFSLKASLLLPRLLTLVLLASKLDPALAQAPLPGEQPLDAIQFKGSHNSYERSQANDRQIAEYNCWAMEFDLNWDGCTPCGDALFARDIWVAHGCPIVGTTTNLRTELRDAMRAPYFANRITIFNLEMKNNGATCAHWGEWPPNASEPENAVDLVKERVELALADVGLSFLNVYTPMEFVNGGALWPSWQELVRRRKYLIIVLQTGGLNLAGKNVNQWFFNALGNPGTWTSDHYNYAFVNRELGTTNGISISPLSIDRWMWRSWPNGVNDSWQAVVDRGYNEIASNNINQDYTNDGADVHSSQPLFVNWAASLTEWGTFYRPYNTLREAYNRASPGVDVLLSSGTYNEQLILAKPMRLTTPAGLVRIGAP